MPVGSVLLAQDETILRLFPLLRRAWSLHGEQARVDITGRNAERVLFATINLETGHQVIMRRSRMRQEDFQDFLRLLRRRYGKRPVWMLLDEAPCHTAKRSWVLAAQLDIRFIFLPKQCAELNAMDQLWKELKGKISANYQFAGIEEPARQAEEWLMSLSKRQALLKAAVLSKNYWLRSFLQ
jgi:hypothetical protein